MDTLNLTWSRQNACFFPRKTRRASKQKLLGPHLPLSPCLSEANTIHPVQPDILEMCSPLTLMSNLSADLINLTFDHTQHPASFCFPFLALPVHSRSLSFLTSLVCSLVHSQRDLKGKVQEGERERREEGKDICYMYGIILLLCTTFTLEQRHNISHITCLVKKLNQCPILH